MAEVNHQNWLAGRKACESEDVFLTDCVTTRAVGLWAAGLLGLDGQPAMDYAQALVVDYVRPGPFDMIGKLRADFQAKGLEVSEHRITVMIDHQREAACRQISLRVWSKNPGDGGWERRIHPRFMVPKLVMPPLLQRWLQRHRGADGIGGLPAGGPG